MSVLPRRQFGILATVGVVAIGAIAAATILATSGKASDVNLTTAQLVPADAGLYVALNTDLSSSQWVSAFSLIKRLGAEDPEQELRDTAEGEGGLDWEDDVAPFLGGNAAFYVSGFSVSEMSVKGALILRAKDAERAMEVILEQGGEGDKDAYKGIDYFGLGLGLGGGFVARIEDHLVIAFDEASLEDVIDVHAGTKESLASLSDFKRLRDELSGNFLSFVYIDAESLAADAFLEDPIFRDAIDSAGAGDLVFKPSAWVIGAKDNAFEFHSASVGGAGVVSPMLQPRESKLIKRVPSDASIFFSTTQFAQTWDKVVAEAGDEIDSAIAESGEYDSLDDALRDAGRELGLQSLDELIDLFDGEFAVAAWFPAGDQDSAEAVLLAEVDEAEARRVLDTVLRSGPNRTTRTEKVNGTDVTITTGDDGEDAAFAIKDGVLMAGTLPGVTAIVEASGQNLAELDSYRSTVAQVPGKLGTYAYFDLGVLLRLAEGGIPADLDEVERALDGLIINAVDQNGVIRLTGILTIDE